MKLYKAAFKFPFPSDFTFLINGLDTIFDNLGKNIQHFKNSAS